MSKRKPHITETWREFFDECRMRFETVIEWCDQYDHERAEDAREGLRMWELADSMCRNNEEPEAAAVAAFAAGKMYGWLGTEVVMLPDAERGRKVLRGSKDGSVAAHGTPESRERVYRLWQADIERRMKESPHLSFTSARHNTARHFGVSFETVKNHTANPRKLMQKK